MQQPPKFILSTILLLSFIYVQTSLVAQTIQIPADSIDLVLCKKWEANYAIINGIIRSPALTGLTYEFKKDKTCSILDSTTGKKIEGKWLFDSQKNIVNLFFRKDAQNDIISLTENDLVIQSHSVEKETGRSVEIKTFLKRKE